MIGQATDTDCLVFTFSGHGSWLPDDDRDEPDARDEMMCPYDVMKEQYLLDDELHDLFNAKAAGARIYVVADSCHSGSVSRYASAPAEPDQAPVKARFLPPYMFARGNRMFERAIDRAINTPAPTKLRYPAVLFSGCQDTEFSYDTSFNGRPNGALTRVAIDALQDAAHHDASRAARCHPAKASRTFTAANPAAVRKPRSQAGSVVLMSDATVQDTGQPAIQEWAALFYLCGHFNRTGDQDPFVAALSEIQQVGGTMAMSAAVYLDLESGAQRVALRHGEQAESEFLGAVNSGDPETLEQFLLWAFDACPARRYLLVMAGLGIMDSDSVVGRPPFDAARLFAICDDRATNDAIELHELSATLKAAFPPDGARRLVLLACDMYAMQFMEVAYELRGVLDLLLGIQPDDRENSGPLPHWPYARFLRRWQELVANSAAVEAPRWRSAVDPQGLMLAKESVSLLSEHYTSTMGKAPVTVSAIDLEALVPVAQGLDTFSVVYLQWLSNDVIWRAREMVVKDHTKALEQSWSYDLSEVAMAIVTALKVAANEAVVRWAVDAVPGMPYPSLSRTLRVMSRDGSEARRNRSARRSLSSNRERDCRLPRRRRTIARRCRR